MTRTKKEIEDQIVFVTKTIDALRIREDSIMYSLTELYHVLQGLKMEREEADD